MSFFKGSHSNLLLSGHVIISALFVSLMIDSLITERLLSAAGLITVSLMTLHCIIYSLLCSIVLSGSSISINQSVGSKDIKLAGKQFSNTLYAQMLIGLNFALVSSILLHKLPALFGAGESSSALILKYLSSVVLFYFVFSISVFTISIAYCDGDVNVASAGQLFCIVSNIVLKIYLAKIIGILGSATAAVLSNPIGCVVFVISDTLICALTDISISRGESLVPMASLHFCENNGIMLRRSLTLSLKCVIAFSVISAFLMHFFTEAMCRLFALDAADTLNIPPKWDIADEDDGLDSFIQYSAL